MQGVLLLPPRAPLVRPASRKSRQAAPELPCVRVTHYLMRVCLAVRRAGQAIGAELDVGGLAWLMLHSPGWPGHPVGLRVRGSSGPRSHEADITPNVAPAAGPADGRAAVLRNTLCSNTVAVYSRT